MNGDNLPPLLLNAESDYCPSGGPQSFRQVPSIATNKVSPHQVHQPLEL